jgi:uncharacterized flavoprotein (TIGR03862 family)
MAAEVIARAGFAVALYDAMPSVGRKFLLAGVGGMNITHAEPAAQFLRRYAEAQPALAAHLNAFDAGALRAWVQGLGIDTFVGSSGRVFPTDMKAAPLLRAWLHRLRELGVKIYPRHRWLGWADNGALLIQPQAGALQTLQPSATLLALGGASWRRLGSDGSWQPLLQAKSIAVSPLLPSNCGFECAWSDVMRTTHAGAQLSATVFSARTSTGALVSLRGEAIITAQGIEGSAVYALSALLRDQIIAQGSATLTLDLLPDFTPAKILQLLHKPRGKNSLSNFLRKQLNLPPVKIALLRECLSKAEFDTTSLLATKLKALPLLLTATRPLDEAISSAGGIAFSGLTPQLMLQQLPGVFCAGEMLDWEAPTGGYLLTACFATGRAAGLGLVDYLNKPTP